MVSPLLEATHVNTSGYMQHTIMKDILLLYSSVRVVEPTQVTTPMCLALLEEIFIVKQLLQQVLLTGLLGRTLCGTVLAVHVALKDAAVLRLAGSTRQCPSAPQTTLR